MLATCTKLQRNEVSLPARLFVGVLDHVREPAEEHLVVLCISRAKAVLDMVQNRLNMLYLGI